MKCCVNEGHAKGGSRRKVKELKNRSSRKLSPKHLAPEAATVDIMTSQKEEEDNSDVYLEILSWLYAKEGWCEFIYELSVAF